VLLRYKENNDERTNTRGGKAIETEARQRKKLFALSSAMGHMLLSYTLQVFYTVCRSKTAHGFSHQICSQVMLQAPNIPIHSNKTTVINRETQLAKIN